jgi:23S rRNA pseudouridine1911/1915/1917 synthase
VNRNVIRIVSKTPGGRLDQILAKSIEDLSRSRLQKLIRDGRVYVNGIITTKPSFQLVGNEIIELEIPPPKPTTLEPEPIPLDIVFENKDLMVINKPAGMVVHPSAGHESGTLVHAVLAHAPDIQGIGGEQRPGVVHRLDKDTSGLILMAKNDAAYYALQKQFTERTVQKTYKKIENFENHSLLEVHPMTGRTHQIRLHLAFIGCPVVGDRVYGRRKTSLDLNRHFLHASKIMITLPGMREAMVFKAPLAEDLEEVLSNLRKEPLQAS